MNTMTYIILALMCLWFFASVTKILHMQGKLKMPALSTSGGQNVHWWNSDTTKTMGLVTLGLLAINVLCNRIGFLGWSNVENHRSFVWINVSILVAVFIYITAKSAVAKCFAGLILLIIIIGVGQNWWSKDGVKTVINTVSAGEWSPPIVLLDNRVKTYPDHVPVEFEDMETGNITVVGPNGKVHLKDVNVVRIRSKEKIRYTVTPLNH